MPRVGFFENKGNRLNIEGCKIKKVVFIPEQEMSSIENTRTIIDPDTNQVIGIEKNIVHTVTVKLKPDISEKADEDDADEKPGSKGISLGKQP